MKLQVRKNFHRKPPKAQRHIAEVMVGRAGSCGTTH